MTREEAIEQIKWYFEEDDGISAEDITKEAVYMAIEALTSQNLTEPNNVCEVDLIRREHAIEAVEKAKTARSADGEIFCAKINAQMNIQYLPSAQPERKKGEWESFIRCFQTTYHSADTQRLFECSVCRYNTNITTNFCPNCGADMRGE